MRSVIRSIAPHAVVLDITHGIPPHDLRAGALALVRAVQYLPGGVVLAVVDPGVGTDRRAVAIEAGDAEPAALVFVGPDNGLLAAAVSMTGGATRAVSLTNDAFHLPAPGPTFAGRDVMAPAAAHLCNGVPLGELGEEVDPVSLLPGLVPLPREEGGQILAEVLWVDRFGNAQLNVGPEEVEPLGDRVSVRWGNEVRVATRASTYADVTPGQLGLVVDSYGLLSLAMDRRSAADDLRLRAGDAVTLEEPGASPHKAARG